jgi:hypothetical protein
VKKGMHERHNIGGCDARDSMGGYAVGALHWQSYDHLRCRQLLHASLRKVLLTSVLADERNEACSVLVRVHALGATPTLYTLSQGGVTYVELDHAVDVGHVDGCAPGTRK